MVLAERRFTVVLVIWVLLWVAFIASIAFLIYFAIRMLRRQKPSQEEKKVRRSLAEALKAQRAAHGLTQEAVAEALGISRQAVSKWENGTAEPSTANLLALAKLYGVDLGKLLDGVEL